MATFLVFSWLSFIGSIFFFRAFSLTFRGQTPGATPSCCSFSPR